MNRPTKEEKHVEAFVMTISALFIIGCLSGCTSNQNTNGNHLSGIWVGSVEMPMFGGQGNTSVSQITFTDETSTMTLLGDRGTFTMDYTYSVNGDLLVFEPKFTNRNGFPGGQPNNGSLPPNGTRPWNDSRSPMNGTWAPNGTRPNNDTRPSNWTRPPGSGQPSLSVTYQYRFNEDYTILYLNGAPFTKIQ